MGFVKDDEELKRTFLVWKAIYKRSCTLSTQGNIVGMTYRLLLSDWMAEQDLNLTKLLASSITFRPPITCPCLYITIHLSRLSHFHSVLSLRRSLSRSYFSLPLFSWIYFLHLASLHCSLHTQAGGSWEKNGEGERGEWRTKHKKTSSVHLTSYIPTAPLNSVKASQTLPEWGLAWR